jgi:hypothetical protein
MEQTKHQFPGEEVTLPSKGLLYPEGHPLKSGKIEMKYMTAREEDILTNPNLIENGTVIDKLLQSLIITPFDYNDLLVGDKNAILIAARILGYGKEYEFKYNGEPYKIDLTQIEDKSIDESLITNNENKFFYTLPTSKQEITFKFLTHKDENLIANELKGLKKLNKNSSSTISTRMKYVITSVGGDSETKTIREFIDTQLLAIDSRALRNYIESIQPDVDLTYECEDKKGNLITIAIPIGLNFFWPDIDV